VVEGYGGASQLAPREQSAIPRAKLPASLSQQRGSACSSQPWQEQGCLHPFSKQKWYRQLGDSCNISHVRVEITVCSCAILSYMKAFPQISQLCTFLWICFLSAWTKSMLGFRKVNENYCVPTRATELIEKLPTDPLVHRDMGSTGT